MKKRLVFTEHTQMAVGKTDDGVLHCSACGREWQSRDVRALWPIRFRCNWKRWKQFSKHGWESGSIDMGVKLFTRVYSIGPLRIEMGPPVHEGPASIEYVSDKQKWVLLREAETLIKRGF